ncbi:MAG: oxidoreductase [Candidatus Kapaibacterium sp.]|nr:MAG: oxidoreductase [Candidatus Kapabacteria bacterium]GIV56954.1 MAG: oxidoreductase [Candidatus Kapabacteria bacterium]
MMRQIAQHLQSGKVSLEHVPLPTCSEGAVLVRVVRSLVSVGTERASLESGKQSLLERARKHPDQVRTVIDMLRRNGIGATIATIRARLDAFRPLGYSAAGIVVESRCQEYAAGDRVACAGAQYAHHAEYIAVPKHLVARIPESVSFDEAAYTTLGAIALQGIRQASPRLGETVLVIGLGLLGQLTCALLRANGCRVIGMDIRSEVFDAARASGCDQVLPSERGSLPAIMSATNSHGADCVIITASTPSNAPLELAIAAARKKAAIVVVGAVGMNVPRGPFYEKELELKIATSYGPGRYDPLYEERGVDYPFAYVRWTEQRNMAAFLDALARRTIAIEHLTTHRIPFEEAERAYQLISEPGTEPVLGVLLCYPAAADELPTARAVEYPVPSQRSTAPIGIGFLGAGGFAQSTLLPILRRLDVRLEAIATRSPLGAHSAARHFGFRRSTTDVREVIADPRVELAVCATRHDTHAEYVCAALDAGKAVFVEKPLCRTPEELAEIDRRIARWGERVMVGFNRRFSPAVRAIAEHFAYRAAPMAISYRFNAGALPPSSWIQDPTQGGRIIGEACHALDVMVFLTGSLPVEVVAYGLPPIAPGVLHDTVSALIRFADGSIGTLHYWSNGDRAIEKEWCEVFCQERSAILENFHHIRLARDGKERRYRFGAGKGHREELQATVAAVSSGAPMPIPYEQLRAVTLATFAIVESLRAGGRPVLLESLDPRTQSANR